MAIKVMNKLTNSPLAIVLVVFLVLFLLLGTGAMAIGSMNGAMHGDGWMTARGWMWTPSLLALSLAAGLGWVLLKRKE